MFCVYLTVYYGNKLPPFYIGHSTVQKIKNGYSGSVCSKQYGKIWRKEKREQPHLFKTKILQTFLTREDAAKREYELQKKLKVHKNPLYTNLSINGKHFCIRYRGKDNPMWGKHHSAATKLKISEIHKQSGRYNGANNYFFGRTHSSSVKKLLSEHGKIKWDLGSREKIQETLRQGIFHTPWGDFARIEDAVRHPNSFLKDKGTLRDWCINSHVIKRGKSFIRGKSPKELGFGFTSKI